MPILKKNPAKHGLCDEFHSQDRKQSFSQSRMHPDLVLHGADGSDITRCYYADQYYVDPRAIKERNRELFKKGSIILGKFKGELMTWPENCPELNRNILLTGRCASGKSRNFIIPNILQLAKRYPRMIITEKHGGLIDEAIDIINELPHFFNFLGFEILYQPKTTKPIGILIPILSASKDNSTYQFIKNQLNLKKYKISIECGENMIINDAKGEYYDKTADTLRAQGYIVKKIGINSLNDAEAAYKQFSADTSLFISQKYAYFYIGNTYDESLYLGGFYHDLICELLQRSEKRHEICTKLMGFLHNSIPTTFILDEFPAIGKIPGLYDAMKDADFADIYFILGCQNIRQIDKVYSDESCSCTEPWERMIRMFDVVLDMGEINQDVFIYPDDPNIELYKTMSQLSPNIALLSFPTTNLRPIQFIEKYMPEGQKE